MSRIPVVSRVSMSLCVILMLIGLAAPLFAQQSSEAVSSTAIVPPLVNFSGVLTDLNGKPLTNITGVTFLVYKEEQGGAPLWLETQNVQPNKTGLYSVMLGSTTSTGLPADLFVAGEARWLAVQPEGQAEKPRVMLVSVPYALKSRDAETVGGLPPSAFVRATPASISGNGSGARASNAGTAGASTGTLNVSGKAASAAAAAQTQNYVAKFVNTAGGMGNSLIFDNGTSIGIGTSKPADALDVVGGTHVDFSDLNSGTFGSNLVFGDSSSGEGISSARQGTSNKWGLDFWTYKQRRMSITSTGKVGIGTPTPTDALDVVGSAHLDFSNQNNGIFGTNLVFGDSTSGEGISSARQGTTNKWGLDFWTYKQRRMSITSSGNVGIGTATPAALLEVNGTAKFDSPVTFAAGQTFPGVPLLSASNVFSGNQTVNGTLTVDGTIQSTSGGVTFPDGTTQTTAAKSAAVPMIQLWEYSDTIQPSYQHELIGYWNSPFPDTNYSIACSLIWSNTSQWNNGSVADVWLDHLIFKQAGSFELMVVNTMTFWEYPQINCIGIEPTTSASASRTAMIRQEGPMSVKPQ